MTTKTLVKKVSYLEKRLSALERHIVLWPEPTGARALEALGMLQGLWAKHPRTKRDLKRVRERVWGKN